MFCSGTRRTAGTGRISRTYSNSRTGRRIVRTIGRIRTEMNRPKIRTAIRMIYPLIPHPMRRRIMVEIIIPPPIITCMMDIRAIMCPTIGTIMIRYSEIEQATIRIIDINTEIPSSSGYVYRPIEIISSHKPAILYITQYPTKIIITNIQCFIVIIQCPFIATCHITIILRTE